MKAIELIKGSKVFTPCKDDQKRGIIAFQLVTFKINFYGRVIESTHDTKIMKDGKQLVIGGCGYIKEGYEVN